MATAVETGLRTIPLASINFNPNNPRKSHDKGALKELAESIKAHGVIEPVVVRPDPWDEKHKTFELVVGERRVRASKLANQESIVAIVREMSDRQALEIMVIENDQREDPHPLDQARGYKSWLSMPDDATGKVGTVEELAQKTGNSVSWILARLKLLELVPAAQEALDQLAITPSHAVLIARLIPSDQIEALKFCFGLDGGGKEKGKDDPASLKFADVIDTKIYGDSGLSLSPEKALREWIQDNVNLKLKGVPWDLADAELVPAAGACITCPKRSGSNPALFAELTVKGEDTCFDAVCFKGKREAFVLIELKRDRDRLKDEQRAQKVAGVEPGEKQGEDALRQLSEQTAYTKAKPDQSILKAGQWLPAKRGSCPTVEPGIIVRGENAGQRHLVCCNAACKVHKHKLSEPGTSFRNSHEDHEANQFRQHRNNITSAKKTLARVGLVREIVGKVGTKMPMPLLRALALDIDQQRAEPEMLLAIAQVKVEKGKSDAKLRQMIEKGSESVLNKLLIADLLAPKTYADDKKERLALSMIAKAAGIKNPHGVLSREDDRVNRLPSCRECGCTEETACDWYDNGRKACSWTEPDLCSNPECQKRAKAKQQTPAAPEKAKKGKR